MTQLIIVPHTQRKRLLLKIRTNNTSTPKSFHILYDGCKKESKNEDPFIWNDHFLYTFCHGNDVFTKDLINGCSAIKGNSNKKPNDDLYIVFVNLFNKECGRFAIDTIIKVVELIKLPKNGKKKKKKPRKKGEITENKLKNILSHTPLKDSADSIIKYHFPSIDEKHNFTQHPRRQLWIAMGDKDQSFLPMVKCEDKKDEYGPFIFNKEDSNKIKSLIKVPDNPAYYVAEENKGRIKKCQKLWDSIQKVILNVINGNVYHQAIYKLKGKDIKEFRFKH